MSDDEIKKGVKEEAENNSEVKKAVDTAVKKYSWKRLLCYVRRVMTTGGLVVALLAVKGIIALAGPWLLGIVIVLTVFFACEWYFNWMGGIESESEKRILYIWDVINGALGVCLFVHECFHIHHLRHHLEEAGSLLLEMITTGLGFVKDVFELFHVSCCCCGGGGH